jgi:hypothetical protein
MPGRDDPRFIGVQCVDLSHQTIQGVAFCENVREVLATVLEQTSASPPTCRFELLFSFKGVKRVELPEERIRAT